MLKLKEKKSIQTQYQMMKLEKNQRKKITELKGKRGEI